MTMVMGPTLRSAAQRGLTVGQPTVVSNWRGTPRKKGAMLMSARLPQIFRYLPPALGSVPEPAWMTADRRPPWRLVELGPAERGHRTVSAICDLALLGVPPTIGRLLPRKDAPMRRLLLLVVFSLAVPLLSHSLALAQAPPAAPAAPPTFATHQAAAHDNGQTSPNP